MQHTLQKTVSTIIINGSFEPTILSAIQCHLFFEMQLNEITETYNEVCIAAIKHFKPVTEGRMFTPTSRRNQASGNPITKYDDLYLASEETTSQIYIWHKEQMALKGFITPGSTNCAYLVAHSSYIDSCHILINAMHKHLGVTERLVYKVEKRDALVKLITKFLVTLASENNISLNPLK